MAGTMISIPVPAYRAGPFLRAALDGVAAQSETNWELIVVEDGSQDETREIVSVFADEHAGHRVVYENLERNYGVSVARNRAIALAKGDVLAFLDADDIWFPSHLHALCAVMAKGPQFAMSGFEVVQTSLARRVSVPLPSEEQLLEPVPHLLRSSFIHSSSIVAMTRSCWEKAGPFDSSLRIGEDLDVWIRAIRGHGLAHTGCVTCAYRKHPGSAMADLWQVARDRVAFLKKQLRQETAPSSLLHALIAEAHLNLTRLLWRRNLPAAARSFAFFLVYASRSRTSHL